MWESGKIFRHDWVKRIALENRFEEDTRIIAFTSEGNSRVIPGYAAVSAAKARLAWECRKFRNWRSPEKKTSKPVPF